ncbi:LexA repressor [compost metagenome]
MLLIRQQEEVEDGEIAAVLVEDEVFLKRVYKQNGSLIMQSENPAYPPIIAKLDSDCFIKVIGKLKKVIIDF